MKHRTLSKVLSIACIAMSAASYSTVNAAENKVFRTEFHPVATTTLSDNDILAGKTDGKANTIAGALNIPKKSTEKVPAVIILHGSSGPGGTYGPTDGWVREFNALGVATFALDALSGRGLTSLGGKQAALGRLAMAVDAYSALGVLAKNKRIDPNRIALLGLSRGGQAAVYAAMKRLHSAYAPEGAEFAAFIATYPNCVSKYRDDGITTGKPIRILHGAEDDYNPMAPCKSYVERAKAAGANIQLFEYPGGQHGFDLGYLSKRGTINCKSCQTARSCKVEENAEGVLMNLETSKPFTYADTCVQKGTTIAYHPTEGPKARAQAAQIIKTVFGMN